MKPGDVTRGVELVIRRAEAAFVEAYRDTVWIMFLEILNNTPQFTGRAVANWNIGLDTPNHTQYPELGDAPNKAHFLGGALKRGDGHWIEVAKSRNAPEIPKIKRSTRVYFTNSVQGDTDGGKAGEFYMDALQDSTYWIQKLRAVNRPYETAAQTISALGNKWSGRKIEDMGAAAHLGQESYKEYLT